MADLPTPPAGEEQPRRNQQTSPSLLDGLRKGQADAWFRLDRLYKPLVRYWCTNQNVAATEVDDICQEVFSTVLCRLNSFSRAGSGSFRAWLRAITRNHVHAYFRKTCAEPLAKGDLQEIADVPPPDDPSEEVAALYHRALDLIRCAFPPRHLQAFLRFVVDGQPAPKVAEELGISAATVRTAKCRILKRLHEELGDA